MSLWHTILLVPAALAALGAIVTTVFLLSAAVAGFRRRRHTFPSPEDAQPPCDAERDAEAEAFDEKLYAEYLRTAESLRIPETAPRLFCSLPYPALRRDRLWGRFFTWWDGENLRLFPVWPTESGASYSREEYGGLDHSAMKCTVIPLEQILFFAPSGAKAVLYWSGGDIRFEKEAYELFRSWFPQKETAAR